jgi:septal ring factor EnvC (AmiA/AmiB activator)
MQDHMAHLQTHLAYATDPLYGSNPIMAPVFIPAVLEHIKQHLTLWYLNQADTYTTVALGRPFNILKVEPVIREAQQLLAAATQHVHKDSGEMLDNVGNTIGQMLQMVQQMRGAQQPQDPSIQALVQTQMAETQRKAAKDQADAQIKMQDMAAEDKRADDRLVAEQQIKAAELTHDVNTMTLEQQFAREQYEAEQRAAEAQAAQQEQAQLQAAMQAQQAQQSNLR